MINAGKGKIQKVTKEGKVDFDYNEILATTEYKNLTNLFYKNHINPKEIAETLGITIYEFIEKLNGEKIFYIEEAEVLQKKFFADFPIEYIFHKDIDLSELAHNLDDAVGWLLLDKITIEDINTLASKLSINLDNIKVEEFKYHYHEINHQVRVMSFLIRNVFKELNKNYKEINKLKDDLLDTVVNGND